jgi:hypothetical protein
VPSVLDSLYPQRRSALSGVPRFRIVRTFGAVASQFVMHWPSSNAGHTPEADVGTARPSISSEQVVECHISTIVPVHGSAMK